MPTNFLKTIYQVIAFALPISAANLVNIIANFVAMLMIARLGKETLAAAALSVTTYVTLMTIASTSLYGISILISHHKGQNKADKQLNHWFKNSFWFALLLALPICILLWHGNLILTLFGQDQHLVQLTVGYFHWSALALIPSLFAAIVSQFYTGIGYPKFTLITAAI